MPGLRAGPLPDGPFDVAVVGAGVVGAAIARELTSRGVSCALIEAAADVGTGTSKANTAIHHTGFDAKPGTLEAKLLPTGFRRLGEYAAAVGIPMGTTGALMVAWTQEQLAALAEVEATAAANGYTHTRAVPVAELYEREPSLGPGALGGVEIPDEGIICPFTTTLAFATEAVLGGCALALCAPVEDVAQGDLFTLRTPRGPLRAHFLVNAAGLRSDEIDAMLGHRDFTVTPRRGELIVFDKLARGLVSHIILPVPTAKTKGVLVSPTVYGNVLLGPTADDIESKDDRSTTAGGLAGLLEASERIVPGLAEHEVTATYVGLRAATESRDYQLRIEAEQRYACVGGIRSTGVSASMAIAEHVCDGLADAGLDLPHDARPPELRMPNIGELSPRPYEAGENGRIVCFCERVTQGELTNATGSPIPPADLDGMRRRTRALMGRCQGFFCAANVAATMADAGGASVADLLGAGGGPRDA